MARSVSELKYYWKFGALHQEIATNAAGNINTPQELFTAIQDIWMSFTVDYIQNLYTSIPCRILAVIWSKGYLTKY